MNYTTKQIEDAAKKLRALPAKKRTKDPDSKQAVRMLQAEFAALLERGYSLEQAGRALHNAGIEISALTVLESLGSGSSPPQKWATTKRSLAKSRVAKRSVARRPALPPGQPPTTPSLAAAEPAPARRVLPPPLPPPLPRLPPLPKSQLAAAGPPPLPKLGFQRRNFTLTKATFQVRPDTPDTEL
jgi:hypothetical protein